MSARIDGLDQRLSDLLKAMEQLPEHLKDEARAIVDEAAENTASRLRSELPGTLGQSVSVRKTRELSRKVTVDRPHAAIYEYGTARRSTRAGANRGVMPKSGAVGRAASAERRKMREKLIELAEKGVDGFAPDRVTEDL